MKRHLTERELIEYRFRLASDDQVSASAEHLAGCAGCRERLEQSNRKFAALDLLREDIHASEELISQAVEQAGQPAPKKVVAFGKYRWIGAVAAVLVVGFVILIGSLTQERPTQREYTSGSKSQVRPSRQELKSLPEAEEGSDVRVVAKRLDNERVVAVGEPLAPTDAARQIPATPPATDSRGAGKDLYGTAASKPVQEPMPEQFSFGRERGRVGERLEAAAEKEPVEDSILDHKVKRVEVRFEDAPEYSGRLAGFAAHEVGKEEISGQPPFAPASAIELVTLPRRDNVQLTIYNSADLTLVRERRNLTLKKGWNWLQFMWAHTLIDPTSLSLEPLAQVGKIDIEQLVFPARLRELGRWLIRSEISGQVPFEITYFTSGLSWRAFYMGTLSQDEKTMCLQGYVRVGNSSGEGYEKAQTRLIVGKVHILDQIAELAKRQYPYGRQGQFDEYDDLGRVEQLRERGERYTDALFAGYGRRSNGLKPKEIRKEGLSEYFLYTIEGTETIPDKWGKRLLSFDVEDIEVKSLYKYDEERWGKHAIRFVSFVNDEEHNLGDTPIPNGAVKIYSQADKGGYLSYVGGTSVKYIPVDEEVELNLGPARLVEVEPKLMDFETDNYVFNNKGNISGWDEIRTWTIEITNTRTLPIEIEITRGFGTAYWTLQTEIPYEKHDALHIRLNVNLEPRSKHRFSYTVRTYHGAREETLTTKP
ncbi:MAG: hypothetical protein PVJ86_09135 [Phycisphaerales bacterium]|jgi:hypothetical protein